MRGLLLPASISVLGLVNAAIAEAPSVAADIPPVHSLVAMIMEGVGTPDLLVQPGASPHGYSLRPSEARALENAQAVFWIGEGLEPWLVSSIESLASDASVIKLIDAPGTTELPFRIGATFEKHGHGDHEEGDAQHEEGEGHTQHDEAGHEGEQATAHGHQEAGMHGEEHHDQLGHDPHAWLDPENGRAWLDAIAAELSRIDPENADTYRANADAGQATLEAVIDQVMADLAPVRGKPFIVFHDAYQYFETRFDVPAAGSISIGDAADPGAARIKEIRDKVAELEISCVFSEPQFNPGLVQTVFQGTEAHTGLLDPLGTDLAIGPDLYPLLIRAVGSGLADCLK
ncbi:zinc ABC transporter substrate-binding protein [Tropicimonas sp. TH_r6]|uniref:zinc ABC transporter substrate-binding protein n=1 Tax=Tropicimonas sp. TH_r6 TaxID=3082085 RepID=UPI0029543B0E|nr:zinc ABC transporter substrate-binding protein [Tropicimonas sp. TH_r6]MDV7143740.1 zinc ABC transporter substrate-binding protein [Tropicimonas sp. TH_r6]